MNQQLPLLRFLLTASLGLAAASMSNAADPDAKQATVPAKVGDTIPDVAVFNANSEKVRLRAAVKEKPAVVIFYRGGWCPYCNRHLADLAKIESDLSGLGLQLLAIGVDQPSKLRDVPENAELSFTLLSDSSTAAAEAFGIAFTVADDVITKYKDKYQIDLEAASGQSHHRLPHPAVFIVDAEGVIHFAHIDENYRERLNSAAVLAAAKEVAVTK